MGIYLNPRNDGFKKSLNSEIYVDKTELLVYTNSRLDTEQMYICVSRPRRFGKSMAVKMLAAYYCRTCDSRELFQNLKIAQDESYEKHLNQYNVIELNMQDFLSYAQNMEQLIDSLQKKLLRDLKKEYESTVADLEGNLVDVLQQIYADTGEGFVFILDEWDCIFREKKKDI